MSTIEVHHWRDVGHRRPGPVPHDKPTLSDLVAGLSVALVLVPQSLAYARLAGMPAEHGLYAAAFAPLAAAVFATPPYLQTGPVALTSLLTFAAIGQLAPAGSADYVGMAALLALVVGVARVAMGLLRAGVVAYLMSEPFLVGFTSAAALLIVASQLPAAVGVEPPASGVIGGALWALAHPGAWKPAAMTLSLTAAGIIVMARLLHPLVPGVLIATVVGLAAAEITGNAGARIGPIAGLPPVTLALPWGSLPTLIVPGIVIAVVGFAEPASIARTLAARERRAWDPNREFLSQGLANLAAGLCGGFPVGGSFSRSGLNQLAGAKTRWSGAIAGLAVLAFLPFASTVSALPTAVLSAIVITAVAGLVQTRALVGLWRLSKFQFFVASATFLLTLLLAPRIDEAVMLGILLAVAVHLWRELRLDFKAWTDGETLHFEPKGVLWFGSVPGVEETFLALIAQHVSARKVAIHLGGLGRVDLTGALALKALLDDAASAGMETEILDVPPHAQRILGRALEWGGRDRRRP